MLMSGLNSKWIMKTKEKKVKKKQLNELEQLDALIMRGVLITRHTQKGVVHRDGQDEVGSMHETFKDYYIWKIDMENFFLKYNFNDEASFFSEGDSTPILKSGLGYSYIESTKSQRLLKDIREETRNKLKFLRDFKRRETDDRLPQNKTIILHTEEGSQRICLAGDIPLCYSMKGESTQRFRIVLILFRTGTNKTIKEIAKFLNKERRNTATQDILKKEIKKINKNFKSCLELEIDDDLIITGKSGSKNVYSLNRKSFNFKIEK